jgi:hypothetical protein
VDRYGDSCIEQLEAVRCIPRVHVLTTQPRPPSADREQGHVEPSGDVAHPREQRGVPGEVRRTFPLDDESDSFAAHPAQGPPRVVVNRRDDPDRGSCHLHLVTCLHLDRLETGLAQQPPRATGDQHLGARVDQGQGGEVQVIYVQVRHHNGVDPVRETARDRASPPVQVQHGAPQQRVGEDPGAVLDEHGRVPQPVDLDHHVCSIATSIVDATLRRG